MKTACSVWISCTRSGSSRPSHSANPDIPITYWGIVILQRQRLLRLMRLVGLHDAVGHLPDYLLMALRHHAVMDHGDICRLGYLRAFETRPFEDDVIGLPFTRLSRRVHQWGPLSVNRRCLAIGVRLVVIGVEHLDLVTAHDQNAAISAPLAISGDFHGRRPLDVKLDI